MERQVSAPRNRPVSFGGTKAGRVTAIQTHDRNELDIAKCLSVLKGHVKSSDNDFVGNTLMLYKQKDGTVKKIKALYVSDKHIIQDFINVAERIYCGDYLYYSDYDTDEIMIQSIWLKPNTKININGATFENKTSEEYEVICPSILRGDINYNGFHWSAPLSSWYSDKDIIAKMDVTIINRRTFGTLLYYNHAFFFDLIPENVTLRLIGIEELRRTFYAEERVKVARISDVNSSLRFMDQTFYQNEIVETIEFFDFTGDILNSFDRTFEGATSLKNLIGFKFNMSNGSKLNRKLSYLFKDCTSLEEIDLTSSIANNCSDVDYMFGGCTSLRSVKLPPIWERINNLRRLDGRYMFNGCSSLEDIWIHVPEVGSLGFEGTLINRDSIVRLISCLQSKEKSICNIYFSSDVIERVSDFSVLGGTLASKGCIVWVGGKKTYYEVDPDEANIPDFSDVKGGDALAWLVNEPDDSISIFSNTDSDSLHTLAELDELRIPISRSRMLAKAVTMNLVEPKELDSNDTGLEDVVFAGNIETSEVGEDIFDEATGMECVTKGGDLEGDISFDE